MYKYNLSLWLSDETLRKSIDLTQIDKETGVDYPKAIKVDAVEHYNEVSKRSRNFKAITDCDIVYMSGVSEIRVTLESEAVLNIPNRALKVFSSFLANGALSDLVRYNSLFRGSSEKVESSTQDELSNEDLLTILIRCAFRNSKEDKKLLDSVKEVVKSQYQD
ncbi:hypothetical protein BSK65_10725 [Paenibacillus odorifer]|uniref:Uncharacterized protein n=1 Tax=Paenibacillus odorifer TaxID=189426 RepID=A0A1R0ZK06_9BACL|nr:hypothetical protein [Paenibacillus odorifer]OME71506.1 hypothetical protein BSK65_10725 [Paenibacillus odorifer]